MDNSNLYTEYDKINNTIRLNCEELQDLYTNREYSYCIIKPCDKCYYNVQINLNNKYKVAIDNKACDNTCICKTRWCDNDIFMNRELVYSYRIEDIEKELIENIKKRDNILKIIDIKHTCK